MASGIILAVGTTRLRWSPDYLATLLAGVRIGLLCPISAGLRDWASRTRPGEPQQRAWIWFDTSRLRVGAPFLRGSAVMALQRLGVTVPENRKVLV